MTDSAAVSAAPADPAGPVADGPAGSAADAAADAADDAAADAGSAAYTAARAADELRKLTGVDQHDIALVLGSGWKPAADLVGETVADIAATDLPGFAPPAVPGHAGRVRSIRAGEERRILAFLERTHLYEGHGVAAAVHGVRTAVAAGCSTIVLTNGCGGLREYWRPGTPVLISDHINFTGHSPIGGASGGPGPWAAKSPFVDLTDLYSVRLRALCRQVEPSIEEGVYAQMPGPQYETPAEIRMLRTMGADLVGMSTAIEAIAAREAGAEVLGLSLVTNPAAGLGTEPLNHEEVLEAGRIAAERMGGMLASIVARM